MTLITAVDMQAGTMHHMIAPASSPVSLFFALDAAHGMCQMVALVMRWAAVCSMEDVLVSRTETIFGVSPGAFEYGDILAKPKQAGRAMNFFWQHTPQVCGWKHSRRP
jgi:hypothetical protein